MTTARITAGRRRGVGIRAGLVAAVAVAALTPAALAAGTVADMVVQPSDLPGRSAGAPARVLDLPDFERAVNPTDAKARAADARVLRRAGFVAGSVADYVNDRLGTVSSVVVEVRPAAAGRVAAWEAATSKDPALRNSTATLAGFTDGRLITARAADGAVVARLVVFSSGAHVAAVIIVNGRVAPTRRAVIALARASERHIAANS